MFFFFHSHSSQCTLGSIFYRGLYSSLYFPSRTIIILATTLLFIRQTLPHLTLSWFIPGIHTSILLSFSFSFPPTEILSEPDSHPGPLHDDDFVWNGMLDVTIDVEGTATNKCENKPSPFLFVRPLHLRWPLPVADSNGRFALISLRLFVYIITYIFVVLSIFAIF